MTRWLGQTHPVKSDNLRLHNSLGKKSQVTLLALSRCSLLADLADTSYIHYHPQFQRNKNRELWNVWFYRQLCFISNLLKTQEICIFTLKPLHKATTVNTLVFFPCIRMGLDKSVFLTIPWSRNLIKQNGNLGILLLLDTKDWHNSTNIQFNPSQWRNPAVNGAYV